MKIKIVISLFLLLLFSSTPVFAQKDEKEKPNFTGTWEFEKLESSTDGSLIADKNSENFKVFNQFVIEQKEDKVKIDEKIRIEVVNLKTGKSLVSKSESSCIYLTDGRGESNTVDGKITNSITKWKGSILTFKYYDSEKNLIGTIDLKFSKDKNKLISIKERKIFDGNSPVDFLLNPLMNSRTTFTRKA
jgi:hypothetical protein